MNRRLGRRAACCLGLALTTSLAWAAGGYPRIANLWGGGPVVREVGKWARYDLLIFGGGAPEAWREFAAEAHKRNPRLKLLTTAPLMNIGSPETTPWMKREWYLKRPDGTLVKWWADQVYAPNLLLDPCLDALLEQTDKPYSQLLEEGVVDGVFFDSVVPGVSWYGPTDSTGRGQPDDPAEADPRWVARQNLFFDRLRQSHPKMLILANDVGKAHAPHVNGRLFEGGPLLDQVTTGALAAGDAIRTLNGWLADTRQPAITFALMTHPLGWEGWRVGRGDTVTTHGEVERARCDFRRMRLGLCTTLMTDAYYAYDFGTVWYGLPWWYAEYDAPLGQAKGPAQEVFEAPPVGVFEWRAGQPTTGLVLDAATRATPQGLEAQEPNAGAPWQRLFATDRQVVTFEPGKVYRIRATVDILRKPGVALQFNLRTPTGGWQFHDKGVQQNPAPAGGIWNLDVTVIPDAFGDYAAEWHLLGGGAVRLTSLQVELINQAYWRREFEGGMALLNPLPGPVTIKLPQPMRRLKDPEAPRYAVEVDDHEAGFTCSGAWELRAGEGHYAGPGFRFARKPGDTARWTFTAPARDTYTLFVTTPGGKDVTDAAEYQLLEPAGGPAVTLNQRKGDGAWVRLFEVPLAAGQRCVVQVRSSGTGGTVADALRAESAARYNDGAVVESVALEALDGVVLVRP